MAFDFPANPTLGQTVTLGTNVFQWNGSAWNMQSGNIGPAGPEGPAGPQGPPGTAGPTGGVTIAVGDTPPVNPADNSLWLQTNTGALWTRYNDGNSVQWLQVNASLILPPQDSAEYVMVNGLWRQKSISFDPAGLATIDIPVPAAAKIAKVTASVKMGVTAGISFRWSTDGVTFPSGASDYNVAGFYHQSGTAGYGTQASTPVAAWNLTPPAADNLAIFHTVDLTMGLRRGAGVFTGKWIGSSFNNAATAGMVHYPWTGFSNYAWVGDQIKTMRLFATAGTFTQGVMNAEWIY